MKEIIMPQVGQDVPTAEIIEWEKSEGDSVEKGEIIAMVESDKAVFEVEAEEDGVLTHIFFEEGEQVDVFDIIGYINGPKDEEQSVSGDAAEASADTESVLDRSSAAETDGEGTDDEVYELDRPRSSPAARRLARQKGVDLTTVEGTGYSGRILFADVEEAVEARSDVPSEKDTASEAIGSDNAVRLSSRRETIARRMSESSRTIPHFYLRMDVDMTAAQEWRRAFNVERNWKLTITDILVKAAAVTLRSWPDFNAFVESDRIVQKGNVNIGVATSVDDGLVVPVIADADRKSLREISDRLRSNTEAARSGQINQEASGTFTISSLGMFGVKDFNPIINPPQSAILAVGAAEQRVVPVEGGIGVREMMTLTLGADHRAVDGAHAAKFLSEIQSVLENIRETSSNWTGES